jgi:hypothetical protein
MFPAKQNLNIYTLSLEEIDGKKLENVTKKILKKKTRGEVLNFQNKTYGC